jgi:hypothetical protein
VLTETFVKFLSSSKNASLLIEPTAVSLVSGGKSSSKLSTEAISGETVAAIYPALKEVLSLVKSDGAKVVIDVPASSVPSLIQTLGSIEPTVIDVAAAPPQFCFSGKHVFGYDSRQVHTTAYPSDYKGELHLPSSNVMAFLKSADSAKTSMSLVMVSDALYAKFKNDIYDVIVRAGSTQINPLGVTKSDLKSILTSGLKVFGKLALESHAALVDAATGLKVVNAQRTVSCDSKKITFATKDANSKAQAVVAVKDVGSFTGASLSIDLFPATLDSILRTLGSSAVTELSFLGDADQVTRIVAKSDTKTFLWQA